MPGLYGIISKREKNVNINELNLMENHILKEDFYNIGKYINTEFGLYLGWTVHKNSFTDCMPCVNEKADKILVFSGENYTDPSQLDELKKRNHSYDKKNASYIVHMYEECEDKFLELLNGYYQGVIIDIAKKKLLLFVDRFEVHKLYFLDTKDAFYFSYKLSGIINLAPSAKEISYRNLARLLTKNNFNHNNKTILKNIQSLQGGNYIIFNEKHERQEKKYFHLVSIQNQTILERNFFYENLKYELQKILKRYFKSEDKLGIFITDDYSIKIIIENALFGTEKVPFYMAGGLYYNLYKFLNTQRVLKSISGQNLKIINLDNGFIENFLDLLQRAVNISDGTACVEGAAELYISKAARDTAHIQVSSIYGSQLFKINKLTVGGLNKREIFSYEFRDILTDIIEESKASFCKKLEERINEINFSINEGITKIRRSQLITRTPFLDYDLVEFVFRGLNDYLDPKNLYKGLNCRIEDHNIFRFAYENVQKLSSILSPFRNNCWHEFSFRKNFLNDSIMLSEAFWQNPKIVKTIQEIIEDPITLGRFYINKNYIKKKFFGNKFSRKETINDINLILFAEIIHRVFVNKS
jgi:asparagine synthase (glutamine-hydrolysing)